MTAADSDRRLLLLALAADPAAQGLHAVGRRLANLPAAVDLGRLAQGLVMRELLEPRTLALTARGRAQVTTPDAWERWLLSRIAPAGSDPEPFPGRDDTRPLRYSAAGICIDHGPVVPWQRRQAAMASLRLLAAGWAHANGFTTVPTARSLRRSAAGDTLQHPTAVHSAPPAPPPPSARQQQTLTAVLNGVTQPRSMAAIMRRSPGELAADLRGLTDLGLVAAGDRGRVYPTDLAYERRPGAR